MIKMIPSFMIGVNASRVVGESAKWCRDGISNDLLSRCKEYFVGGTDLAVEVKQARSELNWREGVLLTSAFLFSFNNTFLFGGTFSNFALFTSIAGLMLVSDSKKLVDRVQVIGSEGITLFSEASTVAKRVEVMAAGTFLSHVPADYLMAGAARLGLV